MARISRKANSFESSLLTFISSMNRRSIRIETSLVTTGLCQYKRLVLNLCEFRLKNVQNSSSEYTNSSSCQLIQEAIMRGSVCFKGSSDSCELLESERNFSQ